MRVGAAIRHLRETLPQFMERALVDRDEAAPRNALAPYIDARMHLLHGQIGHIYHPRIYFRFCPPLPPLPDSVPGSVPFQPAFSLRGRRPYLMSAQVLRCSLHALFSDCVVRLEHLRLVPRRSTALSPAHPAPADELLTRIRFCGTSRVLGTLQNYTMLFRYRFDRSTGQICEHFVDQMMPVPGSRVWHAFPSGLGRSI